MDYSYIDEIIAKQQLRITNEFGECVAFLTLWKGITVIFIFDKIIASIMSVHYPGDLTIEEMLFLEDLAIDFFGGANG